MTAPPPLPPRQLRRQPTSPATPPQRPNDGLLASSSIGIGYSTNLDASDPRTSSSQSLIAPATEFDTRRSLLVVYIHGFYGNDQSFRSFPAHVHAFLTELLSETHIVHSKIYPRYKTYRAIQVARDNFSAWLEPHESPTTDVILVGHSMGGLLAAEVVLMPNRDPHLHQPFKHRILGTLSLDSPFLGLNPGIIVSGLSSLFQPAPKTDKETVGSASQSSLGVDPSASDLQLPLSEIASNASTTSSPPVRPNELYDPPFFNDVPFREKPLLSRLRHFASKHKTEGIFNAIGNHIISHLEFGGCIADYPELSARYKRIRALEDVDELKAISEGHPPAAHRRVRFVNYYTLSPGRPKPSPQMGGLSAGNLPLSTLSLDDLESQDEKVGESVVKADSHPSPGAEQLSDANRAAIDGDSDGGGLYEAEDLKPETDGKSIANRASGDDDVDDNYDSDNESHGSMLHLDPVPILDEDEEEDEKLERPRTEAEDEKDKGDKKYEEDEKTKKEEKAETEEGTMGAHPIATPSAKESQPDLDLDLAPIPPEPEEPTPPDLTKYTDKDARKQAEKEAKRQQKAYQQAVKDRSKAIREREKLLEKRRKKSAKEAERLERETNREMQGLLKQKQAAEAAAAAAQQTSHDGAPETTPPRPAQEQPRKLRKFCTLPGKARGRRDPAWVDVYMADVDEVEAHCGLFAPGPHYDKLVGDVGSRVMAWVHDDMSTRAAMAM
ncbi:hypothetical protein LMH87_002540 [Akanthomyces muscarius]|uniref:DUF676 domain-containing protein n=1 Tax=Akanthomyces muscarius TaxID=2231603 RepID=A0A9W8Q6H1_AKAMU|nr:hypothetical protein LMH87_002540 [Akanthomyces muscarius]KAJ4148052.1 hypothetical protein LMH87_002540 [Akanthomyces muscarius]